MSEEFVLIKGEYRSPVCVSSYDDSDLHKTSESTPHLQVKHLACKDLTDLQGEGQVFPHYAEM